MLPKLATFQVYSPHNEHVKLIHIDVDLSLSGPFFTLFLVAWLDDEEFIKKCIGSSGADLDGDVECYTMSKSKPDNKALEKLQIFFEQIVK